MTYPGHARLGSLRRILQYMTTKPRIGVEKANRR